MKQLCRNIAAKLATEGKRRMIPRFDNVLKRNIDYLERFYILSKENVGYYLHRFCADDDDGLHDHPWDSISILLAGSYIEEMPADQADPCGPTVIKVRKPLRPLFHFRKSTDCHRITLPSDEKETWSLFIRFRRKREWGFWKDGVWTKAPVQSRKEIKE